MCNAPYEKFRDALRDYGFDEDVVSESTFYNLVKYKEVVLCNLGSTALPVAEGSAVTDASFYSSEHPSIVSYGKSHSSIGAKGIFLSEHFVKLQLLPLKSADPNKAEKEIHEAVLQEADERSNFFLDSDVAQNKLKRKYPSHSINRVPREDSKIRLLDLLIRAARSYFESKTR